MTDTSEAATLTTKSVTKRPRKMAREPNVEAPECAGSATAAAKRQSKSDQVMELMQRPEGATIEQLVAATGWLPHTTRAALTGLKKKGHVVTNEKLEGQGRVYRVAAV